MVRQNNALGRGFRMQITSAARNRSVTPVTVKQFSLTPSAITGEAVDNQAQAASADASVIVGQRYRWTESEGYPISRAPLAREVGAAANPGLFNSDIRGMLRSPFLLALVLPAR